MTDTTKSSVPASAPCSKPSSKDACSWQYELAYEMEKLNELRRQVAAQEERFNSMQQQFEKLRIGTDSSGKLSVSA